MSSHEVLCGVLNGHGVWSSVMWCGMVRYGGVSWDKVAHMVG